LSTHHHQVGCNSQATRKCVYLPPFCKKKKGNLSLLFCEESKIETSHKQLLLLLCICMYVCMYASCVLLASRPSACPQNKMVVCCIHKNIIMYLQPSIHPSLLLLSLPAIIVVAVVVCAIVFVLTTTTSFNIWFYKHQAVQQPLEWI